MAKKTNRTIKTPWLIVAGIEWYRLFNRLEKFEVDRDFETFEAAWDYAQSL